MQRQVQEKFGKHKETKFFSFERFDKADRLTYIAGFSKEPAVSIVFTLDKKGKITEFKPGCTGSTAKRRTIKYFAGMRQ